MDLNGDGVVVKEEFIAWLMNKDSVNFDTKKAETMWQKTLEADTDGDGEISWDEFIL